VCSCKMIAEAPPAPPSPMKVAMPMDIGADLPEFMARPNDLPIPDEDSEDEHIFTSIDAVRSECEEEELQRRALLYENAKLRNEHWHLRNAAKHRENEQLRELLRFQQQQQQPPATYQGIGTSSPWMPWSGGHGGHSPTTNAMAGYSFGSDAATSSFGSSSERPSLTSPPKIIEDTPSEERTTVMMRNIPNNYTREMLFNLLNDRGFKKKYDLVYLPVDFKKKVGLGYAFINFVDHEVATSFSNVFHGFNKWIAQSDKVCEVTWSDALQGRKANIERYRNSPIMHESVPDLCKPVLFDGNGEMEPFPPPTKRIRPPREWRIE